MKKYFLGLLLFSCSFNSAAMAQATIQAPQASATSFFKTPEQKKEYEIFISLFGAYVNGTFYLSREGSIQIMNKDCGLYKNSKNYGAFPTWANEGVSYACKYSETMEALLVKNKKPIGLGHCKNLEKAIAIFEGARGTPEYLETKTLSDNFISSMKGALNTTFGHSWKGGWYGPDSYDYKCK